MVALISQGKNNKKFFSDTVAEFLFIALRFAVFVVVAGNVVLVKMLAEKETAETVPHGLANLLLATS